MHEQNAELDKSQEQMVIQPKRSIKDIITAQVLDEDVLYGP